MKIPEIFQESRGKSGSTWHHNSTLGTKTGPSQKDLRRKPANYCRKPVKLNQVIRGTANYFATSFSTCRWTFQKLDSWIRMRMRAMKLKRKNYNDNYKLRAAYFRRQLGLLTLEEFCTYRDRHGQARRVIPRNGATLVGVARCETRTPVNVGN